jgi:4-amino-4-deoxy-L-arabinose transferase-like glycosyltransferase
MAKGPPAAYPVLFLVGLACVERRWKPLLRFFLSGAPITAALIALPWFLYVRHDPMYGQLVGDLRNSAGGGRGHSGWFFTYIPPLFVGTAPWSVLWLIGLIAAIRQWRTDRRLRGMVIWVACILIPLSLWGNKQFHYLMPVMPPLMILVGWLLDESLKASSPWGPIGIGWRGWRRG